MRIAIITINEAGTGCAAKIKADGLSCESIARNEVGQCWHLFDAFVFIGAMGICVRTIAPYVDDKHTDPAVVCIDSTGRHVISVLSGHLGGANRLTLLIANLLDAEPVITTLSDNLGLWPLDNLAQQFAWHVSSECMQQAVIAFVNKEPTALLLDVCDSGTAYLERTLPSHVTPVNSVAEITSARFRVAIIVSPRFYVSPADVLTVQYVPEVLTLGIGLARQAGPVEEVHDNIIRDLLTYGYNPQAIKTLATVDIKAHEPVIARFREEGYRVTFFTAQQLKNVEVPTPSKLVQHYVGTPTVSEAAAILAANDGILLLPKQKGANYTIAVAIQRKSLPLAEQGPHVEIVGAGPGDPDLISVRGRCFLQQADLILYAGSLVPRELTECHKPGAVVRSSADMTLEEQCRLMKQFYNQRKLIVRLHTGDPSIFGAIQEQMAFFDREGMHYHITPGISSFLAAAAELRSQFTIPERTQTVILTRGEGRTHVPEREKLHLLARSRSTMCIFLSAAIVDDVQKELLQEYPEDTPVAACYHLTWPDQSIYRGQLKDLSRIVHDNQLTLTTMLVVGEAIDNRQGLSELYSSKFSHLFRKASNHQ